MLIESKPTSNFVRNVQFPAFDVRAAVVDPDDLAAVVTRVHNPHDGPERQRRVSRSGGIHIIGLAVGGRLTVKVIAIPAGGAFPHGQRLSDGGIVQLGGSSGCALYSR